MLEGVVFLFAGYFVQGAFLRIVLLEGVTFSDFAA